MIYRILHGYFHIGAHIGPCNPLPALATHICPYPAGLGQDMNFCEAGIRADMGIPMYYYVLIPHLASICPSFGEGYDM